jgi:hypothetical protein
LKVGIALVSQTDISGPFWPNSGFRKSQFSGILSRETSTLQALFSGRSALDLMLDKDLEGMRAVCSYLLAEIYSR